MQKMLFGFNQSQQDTLRKISKETSICKTGVIREFLDMLTGLDGNIHVVVFDKSNMRVVNNFQKVVDTNDADILNFEASFSYSSEGIEGSTTTKVKFDFRRNENV